MEFKIKYHAHSGFSISVRDYFLLFDYYRGEFPESEVREKLYPLIFASHSHHDHYNDKILKLIKSNQNTKFILSNDIVAKELEDNQVRYVSSGDSIEIEDIKIWTFPSTDMGVSFLLEISGIKIFHAGDLNLWHWLEESTQEEIDEANEGFDNALGEISNITQDIDILFFPLDSRQGKDYEAGAVKFLKKFNVGHFFPMHMWGKYKTIDEFTEKHTFDTQIYKIKKSNEIFEIHL